MQTIILQDMQLTGATTVLVRNEGQGLDTSILTRRPYNYSPSISI